LAAFALEVRVWRAAQALMSAYPASVATRALVGGGEDLELVGDQPVDRPVDPGDLACVAGRRQGRLVQLIDQGVQLRDRVDRGGR
jgi:hypothetical protein